MFSKPIQKSAEAEGFPNLFRTPSSCDQNSDSSCRIHVA